MIDDNDKFVGPGPKEGLEMNSDPAELFAVDGFTIVCPDCGRQERFVEPLRAQAWIVGHYNAEHPGTLPRFSNTQTES